MDKVKGKSTPLPENPPALQAPEQSSSTPPYESKMFLIPPIIAVLVVLLGVGYLVGVKISSPQAPPSVSPQITPYPTPRPNPTADWKTYRNEKLGFMLKYYEKYQLSYSEGDILYTTIIKETDTGVDFTLSPEPGSIGFYLGLISLETDKSKFQNFDTLPNCKKNNLEMNIWKLPCTNEIPSLMDINNVEARKLEIWTADTISSEYIQTTQSPYIQIIYGNGGPRPGKEIFNQVLSTFRFLDQNPWAANISIKPPSDWVRIDCEESINFSSLNPEVGAKDCGVEPGAFIVNIFTAKFNEYEDQSVRNDPDNVFSDHRVTTIGGKPAVQYKLKILWGQPAGTYKYTVITMGEDSYLYLILNNPEFENEYQQLLSNLKFN